MASNEQTAQDNESGEGRGCSQGGSLCPKWPYCDH